MKLVILTISLVTYYYINHQSVLVSLGSHCELNEVQSWLDQVYVVIVCSAPSMNKTI